MRVRLPNRPLLTPSVFLRWSKPNAFPEAFWRRASWLRAGMYFYLAVVVLCGIVVWTSGHFHWVLWLVPITGLLYVTLAPSVVHRRFKNLVLSQRHQVCIQCGYVLAGLPARHHCPECGLLYDFDSLKRAWDDWFALTSG